MENSLMIKSDHSKARLLKEKIFLGGVVFFSILTISPIILIIYKLIEKGIKQISLSFLFETTKHL